MKAVVIGAGSTGLPEGKARPVIAPRRDLSSGLAGRGFFCIVRPDPEPGSPRPRRGLRADAERARLGFAWAGPGRSRGVAGRYAGVRAYLHRAAGPLAATGPGLGRHLRRRDRR